MDEDLRQDSGLATPAIAGKNAAAAALTSDSAVPTVGDGIATPVSDAIVSRADSVAASAAAEFCWDDYLGRLFDLPERDYTQYSPLTLAYIGDAVFDVVIRTIVVKQANMPAAQLHRKTSSIVKAPAQAQIIKALLPHLTKEEASVYRRGRNAQPYNTAKNATRREYLEATGFEALIGYLYLRRSYQRMLDLIRLGMEESGHMLT